MEGRKLQLAGGSTYLVSLPKRWVVTSGLKAGDTVFVETGHDGSVSIRPQSNGRAELRRKVVDERYGENAEHLLRQLVGAYVSGFGLIEIRCPPEHSTFVRNVAREFCRRVTGPEIVEESAESVVVQDLLDTSDLNVDKCLRRMELTVRAMLEDALTALRNSDASLVGNVELRGHDVERLYWMVAKQHHLAHFEPVTTGSNGASGTDYLLVARHLERIGSHARRMASVLPDLAGSKGLDPKVGREIDAARASLVDLLDHAFTALVTRDVPLANETIDARDAHDRRVDLLLRHVATKRGAELLALGTVVDSLHRIAAYASEIAEQGIDIALLAEPDAA